MNDALIALAHVLVFVLWLGGDLGAFYASTILSDPKEPIAHRAVAGRILANLDMAPRSALILAAPTGLTLGAMRGLWELSAGQTAFLWLAFGGWLVLAWAIHLRHAPAGGGLRRMDVMVRMLAGLALVALALNLWPFAPALPLYVSGKMALLAAAIFLGLSIRWAMRGFGPAFAMLAAGKGGPQEERSVQGALTRARPLVLAIWALVTLAAFLGLWRPQ